MVMVVATVEVDGTVVAMMVAALVAVAMPVPMAMVAVMVPVMEVMSGPVLVPLCGRRTGEQHEGGSGPDLQYGASWKDPSRSRWPILRGPR